MRSGGVWLHSLLQAAGLMLLFLRESRRKTPVTVTLKENERFLGDSAAGMVSNSPSQIRSLRG
jgi:hypothetical protein